VKIGGARVIIPEFASLDGRPSDFNDLHTRQGIDAVKAAFSSRVPEITSDDADMPAAPDWSNMEPCYDYEPEAAAQVALYTASGDRVVKSDWQELIARKEDGSIRGDSSQNLILYLENDRTLANIFCYDEFSCQKIVYQCPPWQEPKRFKPHVVADDDITHLTAYIERFGFRIGFQTVARCLDATVKKNPRNPAQEYFKSLRWDGVKRIDTWLRTYCGAVTEPDGYLAAVGRKWLCAAVARVMEPGIKFDHMLVLEGEQGAGKSTLLRELATIHGTAYFDDTVRVHDLGGKECIPKLQGVLIVEIAELAGIRKADIDQLKSAITTTHDRTVLKYQNEPTVFARKFVFAGTVNPTDGYLTDPTGNRRFWPVKVGRMDIAGIKSDREQLWAEAAAAVAEGEQLYMPQQLVRPAAEVTDQRMSEHPWKAEIIQFVRTRDRVDKNELWDMLEIKDRTKRTHIGAMEIGKIMVSLGFSQKRMRAGPEGERISVWVRNEPEAVEIPLD